MEDVLKILLEAEAEAEKIAEDAKKQRDSVIAAALQEAGERERKLAERLPALQQEALHKAEQQARQRLAELERRYRENTSVLRETAAKNRDAALDAAFRLLINGP